MVGLQTLDLAIGVRVPASQPNSFILSARHCTFRKTGTNKISAVVVSVPK